MHKKYEIPKENQPTLVKYIVKTLNYNLIDSDMASYFKDNIDNIDIAIAKKSTLLSFLVDIVYSVVIFLEQKHSKLTHDTIKDFTDHYYIEFSTLIYIIDLVIIDFKMEYNSSLQTTKISNIDN